MTDNRTESDFDLQESANQLAESQLISNSQYKVLQRT